MTPVAMATKFVTVGYNPDYITDISRIIVYYVVEFKTI